MHKRSTVIGALGAAAFALGAAYAKRNDLIALALRLPWPRHGVGVRRDIRIVMPDGAVLLADHYFPKARDRFPTILIRSGYGRELEAGRFGRAFAWLLYRFAERG